MWKVITLAVALCALFITIQAQIGGGRVHIFNPVINLVLRQNQDKHELSLLLVIAATSVSEIQQKFPHDSSVNAKGECDVIDDSEKVLLPM